MMDSSLTGVFLSTLLLNSFVVSCLLGMSPPRDEPANAEFAIRLGFLVVFVMLFSSLGAFAIEGILATLGAPHLRLIANMAVIATAVQLSELYMRRFHPAQARSLGIFLPIIPVNSALIGLGLFPGFQNASLFYTILFALVSGAAFSLCMALLIGLREGFDLREKPSLSTSLGLTLIAAGILALAVSGFA